MRLDRYLAENGFSSRTKAARAIAEGRVLLNGRTGRASDEVKDGDSVAVRESKFAFVSEGGYKLQKAFDDFGSDVRGCICVDLGASTGGFTDCLLQAGAERVFAVDVGKDQLDAAICKDPRVFVLDGMNVRYLRREDIASARIDTVAADLSFISLKLILPVISQLLDEGGSAYVLVKPQFECEGIGLNKHGILKDRKRRQDIVADIAGAAAGCGLEPSGVTAAPIREGKNTEYILRLKKVCRAAAVSKQFTEMVGGLE